MFGWHGRILRVDLTNERVSVEEVDPQVAKDFIGGRGWAIKYLYDEVDPTVDPLAPENKLIFGTGPLTATPAPTGNRYVVTTKSPLTGALSCSNSGGVFPTEMKRTGFDLFIFEGKAERPVYLWVNDNADKQHPAEIRSAEHLWGKTVHQTEDILLEETDPKAKVACIGPAGERLVKIAAIMNDKHRAAARSGVGAVMGSKMLKAVVVRGTQRTPLAEPQAMRKLCKLVHSEVKADVKKGSSLREYGTAYVPPVTNEMGILPTRNFQTGVFEGVDNINGPTLTEKYLIRPKPCFGCPIACGRDTRVDDPVYGGEGEGPEYETIAALGSSCGIDNLAAVAKANYVCNELGVDTISMGVTLSCAMEMYEKGILPESDVGRPLRFGDADAVIALVKKTAYREGFGDALAEGSYRLASKYDHPEFSITAKKLEFPGYDPRGAKGIGLLYATSNIGASHMAGDLAYPEVFGVPEKIDPLTIADKPRLLYRFEDAFTVIDAAGLCVFLSVRYLFDPDVNLWPARLTRLMNHATGAGYTEETLLQAGERIFNLERLFLLKAGFTKNDDTLPKRMLEEPMPDGPAKGHVVELDEMLPEFYRLRGWDEDGVPTDAKLTELGLKRETEDNVIAPHIVTELPGPKARTLLETDKRVTSPSLPRAYPLVASQAQGCVVTDVDGNRFLDLAAGIAVCSTGHCHPRVVQAIQDQAARLIHLCGSDFYYPPFINAAAKLADIAPGPGPWQVFLTNSGAEAVEGALKLARYATGRHRFIAFLGAFHGRTLGTISLTASKPKYRRGFGPLLPGVTHVPYGDCFHCHYNLRYPDCGLACVDYIEQEIFARIAPPEDVAAVIVEPVQGEGGYVVPPPDWLPALRALCDRYGILLIADEVQSGIGRTGKMFAIEHFGVVPDIITVAKGIASGMPLGAFIAKAELMTWKKGAHGSTFGGNPVACAAALETIALIEEGLMENAAQVGAYLLERLVALQTEHPTVADVRGLGLMIGVEFQTGEQAAAVAKACFRRGLIVLGCGDKAVRLSPPLVISREEADVALGILEAVIGEVEHV